MITKAESIGINREEMPVRLQDLNSSYNELCYLDECKSVLSQMDSSPYRDIVLSAYKEKLNQVRIVDVCEERALEARLAAQTKSHERLLVSYEELEHRLKALSTHSGGTTKADNERLAKDKRILFAVAFILGLVTMTIFQGLIKL